MQLLELVFTDDLSDVQGRLLGALLAFHYLHSSRRIRPRFTLLRHSNRGGKGVKQTGMASDGRARAILSGLLTGKPTQVAGRFPALDL
jgi:hypothetical protein